MGLWDLEAEIRSAICALKNIQKQITDGTLNGKSAYEVAVDNGFVGTEQEWLDSLVGGQGDFYSRLNLPTYAAMQAYTFTYDPLRIVIADDENKGNTDQVYNWNGVVLHWSGAELKEEGFQPTIS